MRRTLKIAAWCVVTVVALLIGLLLLNWRYTHYFPKVWGATITVDGKAVRGSAVYRNRSTGYGVLIRRGDAGREVYAFGTGDEKGFILRCEPSGVFLVPGLALSNHEQFAQACVFQNLELRDSTGTLISEPKRTVKRNQVIGRHMVEFTADDGKRVKAEW